MNKYQPKGILNCALILIFLVLIASSLHGQTKADGINGEWLSPQKNSRIVIYKKGNNYFGKITWGTGGSSKDEKNPDKALRSRDVIGLEILKDFEYDGDGNWENGSIYNPREGKTYSCKMTLKSLTELSIRGYVGVSLFGRTEIWTRYK
ncbi:MAG: DUF2147 domain-containing protein [Chitinophagales bacterium]|nr:DUF2147 domain-containing protein [Chitinophagales bacterium]